MDAPEQEDASSSPNAKNITDFIDAEKTALRLIARAEQCKSGLSRKLEKHKYDPAVIDEVISKFIESKLIDDSRYTRLWLQSRLRLTRSPRQLLVSLCSKGIERDEAEAALRAVLDEETEYSLIERFVKKTQKKAARKKNKSEEINRSLKSLLRMEGFSLEVINEYLEKE